jgi:hypothetical protein
MVRLVARRAMQLDGPRQLPVDRANALVKEKKALRPLPGVR